MRLFLFTFALMLCLTGISASQEKRELSAADGLPWMLFAEGKTIELKTVPGLAGKSYELIDETGAVRRSGAFSSDGRLAFAGLDCGFYRLKIDGSLRRLDSFGVVPDPARRRPFRADMPYAMNLYFSNGGCLDIALKKKPRESVPLLIDVLRLCGIWKVREQLKVPFDGEKFPEFEDEKTHRRRYVPKLLAQGGLAVCDFYATNTLPGRTLPSNLLKNYQLAKKYASALAPAIRLWEFWNEPDGGYRPLATGESAWDFAALNKAAMLGFRAGAANVRVTNGSAMVPPPNPYFSTVIRNEIAPYQDYFNCHIYQTPDDYPRQIKLWRAMLDENSGANLPIIVTENGTDQEGLGTVETPFHLGRSGPRIFNHSIKQEEQVAEFIVASQLIMQSLGVRETYYFMFRPCYERNGRKDWGLLRYDCSAKPGIVTFAVLVNELGAARYRGVLPTSTGVDALLFELPDGTQSVAFRGRGKLTVAATRPAEHVSLYGKRRPVPPVNGQIQIPATAAGGYLTGLRGLTPRPEPQPKAVCEKFDQTVIFNLRPIGDGLALSTTRDTLVRNPGKTDFRARVEVVNLGQEKKNVKVAVRGVRLSGLPETLELPPQSQRFFTVSVEPVPGGSQAIEVRGVRPDGIRTTRLYIPLAAPQSYERWSRAEDPTQWTRNSSGEMTAAIDPDQQCLRFDVDFVHPKKVTDRWIYPILQIRDGELKNARTLSFEICSNAPTQKNIVMLGLHKNSQAPVMERYKLIPNVWTPVTLTLPENAGQNLKNIRIGLNPDADQMHYLVRNIRIGK